MTNMFLHIPAWISHVLPLKGAIIFYQEGGRLFVGGPEFFGVIKWGGPVFFSVGQTGGPEFFEGHRGGGPEFFSKMGTLTFRAFGAISY